MQFYKFLVKGIVQGVGFRPYIYRKARQLGLVGSVRNIGSGVEIIINDKEFLKKLEDLPPLARIDGFSTEQIKKGKQEKKTPEFRIIESKTSETGETILPPDIFFCEDCRKELHDKTDRRYGYYFTTCTNCGPRFSLIKDYPYDRKQTTMHEFKMCDECRKEYSDPDDRRYHAETIACKKCGPKLDLIIDKKKEKTKNDQDTIKKTAKLIDEGQVIAIKGVGGFHLCSKISSVGKIRNILGRPDKPFAVMVKDISMASKIALISKKEIGILQSPQRPIVILDKKDKKQLKAVSELDSIGVILPYTALHHLLFTFLKEPLVMTSYNIPGNPMIIDENETKVKHILTHERKIQNRCDDSVIKVIDENNLVFLRRSRGFTPLPIENKNMMKSKTNRPKEILALGAEMNNAIAILKNENRANIFLSQYIGDTSRPSTVRFMEETAKNIIRLTRAKPKIIACDTHPGYESSGLAEELAKRYKAKLVKVQHHKAHVASVAYEHGLKDYVGIAMDGLGYGEDDKLWGGEVFLVKDGIIFERVGHLEEQPMLGGDSSTIHPKKMLFGILARFMSESELKNMHLFEENETTLYTRQLKSGFNIEKTTSAGRILDSAAALLGICDERTYDGRPAMLLESLAGDAAPYEFEPAFERKEGKILLMTTPLFWFLVKNLKKDKRRLAATVQAYLSRGLYEIAKMTAERRGKAESENSSGLIHDRAEVGGGGGDRRTNEVKEQSDKKLSTLPIVFSGGVAYNKMIARSMLKNGVLMNKELPCGDGGISAGQAYIANLMDTTKS